MHLVGRHQLHAGMHVSLGNWMRMKRGRDQQNQSRHTENARSIHLSLVFLLLPSEVVRHLHHLIRRLDRFGINLIAALSDDHVDHFFRKVDIGTL